jgi:dGTP triphosphohydrolase
MKEQYILFENPTHWVYDAGVKGFEVYRNTITHSVRVAVIGRSLGLERAITEANNRHERTKQ